MSPSPAELTRARTQAEVQTENSPGDVGGEREAKVHRHPKSEVLGAREAGNVEAERGLSAWSQETWRATELQGRAHQSCWLSPPQPCPPTLLLTSSSTGATLQGWGAVLHRPWPALSWPTSTREKGTETASSVGGREAARKPLSWGPTGSKGTRPRCVPSGTLRRTTWEK